MTDRKYEFNPRPKIQEEEIPVSNPEEPASNPEDVWNLATPSAPTGPFVWIENNLPLLLILTTIIALVIVFVPVSTIAKETSLNISGVEQTSGGSFIYDNSGILYQPANDEDYVKIKMHGTCDVKITEYKNIFGWREFSRYPIVSVTSCEAPT